MSLGYEHATDFIGELHLQEPATKQTAAASRNMDSFRSYSATLMAPVQVMPKWNINNNLLMARQEYQTVIEGRHHENKQFLIMVQSNHQIKLPMNMMLDVKAAYRGPAAYGLFRFDSQWWMDAGVKRSFMKDKLDLSLNVTDIFRTMQINGGSEINDNITKINQYAGARSIRMNLRYYFNKGEKFSRKSRKTNLEELKRAGGN